MGGGGGGGGGEGGKEEEGRLGGGEGGGDLIPKATYSVTTTRWTELRLRYDGIPASGHFRVDINCRVAAVVMSPTPQSLHPRNPVPLRRQRRVSKDYKYSYTLWCKQVQ